jgi:hypothetical protein
MIKILEQVCQKITIYHKEGNEYRRYVVDASVRSTSYHNRNNTGVQTVDNVLIRIFDVEGYKNNDFMIEIGDVIYSGESSYDIVKAPITELRKLYGKEKVYEVSSVEEFIFDEPKIKKLNHIKIGAR